MTPTNVIEQIAGDVSVLWSELLTSAAGIRTKQVLNAVNFRRTALCGVTGPGIDRLAEGGVPSDDGTGHVRS